MFSTAPFIIYLFCLHLLSLVATLASQTNMIVCQRKVCWLNKNFAVFRPVSDFREKREIECLHSIALVDARATDRQTEWTGDDRVIAAASNEAVHPDTARRGSV